MHVAYSLCEVFLKDVFRVSQRCETPSYKYYLIMIKHSFSLKMRRRKKMKIGLQIEL